MHLDKIRNMIQNSHYLNHYIGHVRLLTLPVFNDTSVTVTGYPSTYDESVRGPILEL
jgi:hypothetical protein